MQKLDETDTFRALEMICEYKNHLHKARMALHSLKDLLPTAHPIQELASTRLEILYLDVPVPKLGFQGIEMPHTDGLALAADDLVAGWMAYNLAPVPRVEPPNPNGVEGPVGVQGTRPIPQRVYRRS